MGVLNEKRCKTPILLCKINKKICKINSITNMKLHYLNHHATKEERKKEFKYYCEGCDFGHFTKALYKAHLETKHNVS